MLNKNFNHKIKRYYSGHGILANIFLTLLKKNDVNQSLVSLIIVYYTGVPELVPQRKQACADNKKDSKLTKINFLLAQITELQSF
jgi:hypothetical protein